MKTTQPDINKRATDAFVASAGANRKLKRLWGTTTTDEGVEVLHAKRHYHKASNRPSNYERLFKFLKVYNDIKDYKGKGIKRAWFTLNKSNGPEDDEVSSDFVVDNLNSMWWDPNDGERPEDLTLTTTIVISEGFGNKHTLEGVDFGGSKEDLAQYVLMNYEALWETKKIVQEGVGVINKGTTFDEYTSTDIPDEDDLSPDDNWMAILSRYALRDTGVPCTIKDVEAGVGLNGTRLYNTLVVTLEIPYFEFARGNSLVNKVMGDLDSKAYPKTLTGRWGATSGFVSSNEQLTQRLAKKVNRYEEVYEDYDDVVTRQYIQWEDATLTASKYENFWVEHDGEWCLKADVIDNPKAYGTTHRKLNAYIFSLLDTDYKKKKVSTWKKITAIVVFIVAVVVTYVTAGSTATWTSKVMAAAYAVIVGGLVVTLATLALTAFGLNEWAMAFAEASKTMAPLVMVASIVFVVGNIYLAANKAAETAAAEAIKSGASTEAASTVAAEVVKESLTTMVFDTITNMFTGTTATSIMSGSLTTTQTISVVSKAMSTYTNIQMQKLENMADKIKDNKAEYDKLVEESAMESDVMISYMNIYAKPATADWSIYASTYDMPYERGGGMLATGNIQKTTKQATRKTDYDEPMFEGILLL